jgi:hypothetical protein
MSGFDRVVALAAYRIRVWQAGYPNRHEDPRLTSDLETLLRRLRAGRA